MGLLREYRNESTATNPELKGYFSLFVRNISREHLKIIKLQLIFKSISKNPSENQQDFEIVKSSKQQSLINNRFSQDNLSPVTLNPSETWQIDSKFGLPYSDQHTVSQNNQPMSFFSQQYAQPTLKYFTFGCAKLEVQYAIQKQQMVPMPPLILSLPLHILNLLKPSSEMTPATFKQTWMA